MRVRLRPPPSSSRFHASAGMCRCARHRPDEETRVAFAAGPAAAVCPMKKAVTGVDLTRCVQPAIAIPWRRPCRRVIPPFSPPWMRDAKSIRIRPLGGSRRGSACCVCPHEGRMMRRESGSPECAAGLRVARPGPVHTGELKRLVMVSGHRREGRIRHLTAGRPESSPGLPKIAALWCMVRLLFQAGSRYIVPRCGRSKVLRRSDALGRLAFSGLSIEASRGLRQRQARRSPHRSRYPLLDSRALQRVYPPNCFLEE